MRQLNFKVIPSKAPADTTSAAIPAANLFAASVQAIGVGAGVSGTVKVQVSNDGAGVLPGGEAPQNWSDVSGLTVSVSAAGAFLIPKFDVCYEWIRVVYSNSGTGTSISVNLKALGS